MNKIGMAVAVVSAAIMVGCVSVDATRAQLNSGNAAEIQKAEDTIYMVATTGRDKTGLIQFDESQRIAYIELSSNNALLLRILDSIHNEKEARAAVNKLDFNAKGFAKDVIANHQKTFEWLRRLDDQNRHGYGSSQKTKFDTNGYVATLFSSLNDSELIAIVEGNGNWCKYEDKKLAANLLFDKTQDPVVLGKMIGKGELADHLNNRKKEVVQKIAGLADKVSDDAVIVKVLKEMDGVSGKKMINDRDQRNKLIAKLSSKAAFDFAMESANMGCWFSWESLTDSAVACGNVEETDKIVQAVKKVLEEIAKERKDCKESWTKSWTKEKEEKATAIMKLFKKFDDKTIEELICADDSSWLYFIDMVSPSVAYNVLSSGKAKSCNQEVALMKKLPKEKLDMKVFRGAYFIEAKKSIVNAMSPEMKSQAKKALEDAFKEICAKANTAAKNTFELDGFYLGMTLDDLKVVLVHHFPDMEIKEGIDGEGKNADYAISVPGQTTPFCYASMNDRKVWQINFGKKLLKKWYQYDVQTPMEWAHAYARETKCDMKYKMIDKDTTIYEPQGNGSYRVWFHQESYQYKHNTKEYRLTYFGEERKFTIEGGLGGNVIKSLAAPRFRYVRGDQGSLRAVIERD